MSDPNDYEEEVTIDGFRFCDPLVVREIDGETYSTSAAVPVCRLDTSVGDGEYTWLYRRYDGRPFVGHSGNSDAGIVLVSETVAERLANEFSFVNRFTKPPRPWREMCWAP
jgi:hypothetical protein